MTIMERTRKLLYWVVNLRGATVRCHVKEAQWPQHATMASEEAG